MTGTSGHVTDGNDHVTDGTDHVTDSDEAMDEISKLQTTDIQLPMYLQWCRLGWAHSMCNAE